jgi:hypothetical protein
MAILVSSDPPPPRGRSLSWTLRHYGWIVLVCVLVGAAAPLLAVRPATTYQAEALVVARSVTNEKVLPTLGASAFADGAVEAAVTADKVVGGGTTDLIPDRLSLVAGPDSITMSVQARDANPKRAAELADVAARAFAAELSRTGSGVGEFVVQGPAVVPDVPLEAVADSLQAEVGGLAGLVLGVGLVALVVTLRRPCVTSRDVETAIGVPLLGTVALPPARPGTYLGARGVRGIATVTRWLATIPSGRVSLISSRSAEGMRHRIFVMVAIAMSTVRPVRLRAAPELLDAVLNQAPVGSVPGRHGDDVDELVLVDGGSPSEILDPADSTAYVVAVAPLGVSQRRLRAMALDYRGGGLVGVVLVNRTFGRRLRGAASSRPGSRVVRPAEVPETEPA